MYDARPAVANAALSAPAAMSAHESVAALAFVGSVRTKPRYTIAYMRENAATRYAAHPPRRRNETSASIAADARP